MFARHRTLLLMAPALAIVTLFMLLPMLAAVGASLLTPGAYGGARWPLSLEAYRHLLYERDFDDTLLFTTNYLAIAGRSVAFAVATTFLCLVIGLPVAWYIACRSPGVRRWLVFAVTLPFWTNLLIRTYCWVLLLRDQGLVNDTLRATGLTTQPLTLLYNDAAVLLGLVYAFLPFMVLPIFATLERLEPALVEAAHDLYATRAKAFRRVVWPLARPGVAAGSLLVFAPALGAYVIPDLLGGGKDLLLGSLIQNQFAGARNWPFGAAVATVLTLIVLAGVALQARGRRSEGAPA